LTSGCGKCAAKADRRSLVLGFLCLCSLVMRPRNAPAASEQAVFSAEELAEPWSAVKFTLLDGRGDPMPGIVIHLPDGGWYASSLICPHNQCDVMYVRDFAVARDSFNVEVDSPVLACPCHFSVFDVLRHGRVISGPAPAAPVQLNVEVREGKVIVSR
jgi:arsenite oxidase small subunit